MTAEQEIQPKAVKEPIDFQWLLYCAAVTAIAAFFRFYWLALKPFHHDEGVNGFFLTTLFRTGTYHYDPANYHGPTLYYIALAFTKVFGLETVAVRSSVAIFGVFTVILTLFLKRYLGKVGTLCAASFLALSPGMVYISRYFIHEMFFVFCSLGVVVSLVYFIDKRKAGPLSVIWMVLILVVAFLPSTLNIAETGSGMGDAAVWALRIVIFAVECVLVFFVTRMLLSWEDGRPIYLLLASAAAAMLFATKETAFITLGTMLIAGLSTWLWRSFALSARFRAAPLITLVIAGHAAVLLGCIIFWSRLSDGTAWFVENFTGDGKPNEAYVMYAIIALAVMCVAAWVIFLADAYGSNETPLNEPADLTWSNFRAALGVRTDLVLILAATATVFVYLIIVFFSSFFTYAEGVSKALEAYAIWTKTGSKDHTQNGFLAYVKWGLKVESPILLLASIGALIALIRAKHRLALFTAFWAFGLFTAYTIIPYKTPWLALSFYLPMCLIAGYGINELFGAKNVLSKLAAALLAVTAAVVLAYQSYDLNFVRYDDEEMGYVYAHTKRQFLDLVRKIDYYADKSGAGHSAAIEFVSPDYWPMPWYMNDYEHATFNGQLVDTNSAEMIVAKKDEQDAEVVKRYSAHYKFVGVYPMRPGVDLVLLVRRDIADPDAQDLYKLLEYESPK
ncbi:MAG: glycosyltransferase family 39 protein [Acidobacteriota bacterium]